MLPHQTDDELDALARANRSLPAAGSPHIPRCTLPVQVTTWGGVSVAGIDVPNSHLTKKEAELLEQIMVRGQVVTKEQLLDALYAGVDEPELKIIDVFVCKLRKKLGPDGSKIIETVWGRGYRVGEGYSFVRAKGKSGVNVAVDTRKLLDEVASECDPKRRPDELADELLLAALKVHRQKLWA